MRIIDWSSDGCSSDLGSNVQQLVITPLAQSAMYCEVGITSQASGSGQARRARLARLAFMVTKANSGAPVIDLIAAQDIAAMLSSLPPVETGRASGRERGCQYG